MGVLFFAGRGLRKIDEASLRGLAASDGVEDEENVFFVRGLRLVLLTSVRR